MALPTKIATCCHCGTRAVLMLDAGHHTLSCQACGAPLNRMKTLPVEKSQRDHKRLEKVHKRPKAKHSKRSAKQRRGKSLWRKFASEAFDLVEDIFD